MLSFATVWEFSEWSECSVVCGQGEITRSTECKGSGGELLATEECGPGAATESNPCEKDPCIGKLISSISFL